MAVKVILPPSTATPEATTFTVGVAGLTTVEVDEAMPETASYAPAAAALNVAE